MDKKEIKLSLFADHVIVYVKKPYRIYRKKSSRTILGLVVLAKSEDSRATLKNQSYFYIVANSNWRLTLKEKHLQNLKNS